MLPLERETVGSAEDWTGSMELQFQHSNYWATKTLVNIDIGLSTLSKLGDLNWNRSRWSYFEVGYCYTLQNTR